MRTTVLLVLAAMMAGCVAEAADATWLTDYDGALALAKKKKLPILADFSGSDWCGWCIKLDKEVFARKEFAAYAKDNLVLFLADFPARKKQAAELKKQNEALAKKYGVRGFPTVLLLDAKGKVLSTTGYRKGGAAKYVTHLQELLAGEGGGKK